MKAKVLELLPSSWRNLLRLIKHKTIDRLHYEILLRNSAKSHEVLLRKIKLKLEKKAQIRVVFIVAEISKWKVDSLFKLMLDDSIFQPVIVVVPFASLDLQQCERKIHTTLDFFQNKGYETYSVYDSSRQSLVGFETFSADLVFFSEPYNLTKNEKYYSDIFLNYLSFYVPYFYMATSHVRTNPMKFHGIPYKFFLSMWRIYWPHDEIRNEFRTYDERIANRNSASLGYPAVEHLYLNAKHQYQPTKAWAERSKGKLKVIYAPHHTVLDDLPNLSRLSTFIENAEALRKLAIKYCEHIYWSFKPHPTLKLKLYQHPDWGRERTDDYYNFWMAQDFTQFDDGEYDDLFLQSDAIIHDCSSFIVEYAFIEKPCLYLVNENTYNILNEFGLGVFDVYEKADSVGLIEQFLARLTDNERGSDFNGTTFFKNYLEKFYSSQLPSERIIKDIKQSLGYIDDK